MFSNSGRVTNTSDKQRSNDLDKTQTKRNHPEIVEDENVKPEKFFSRSHEKRWELNHCKRKIIIKITREDFINEIDNQGHPLSDNFIFKNPVNYEARINGIKMKIYNAK